MNYSIVIHNGVQKTIAAHRNATAHIGFHNDLNFFEYFLYCPISLYQTEKSG